MIGAGIAAVGPEPVNWRVMAEISSSWVTSPLIGGVIAAGLLFLVKTFVIYRDDKIAAARRWVPVLIAIMFDSGLEVQKSYQKSLETIFDAYRPKSAPPSSKP